MKSLVKKAPVALVAAAHGKVTRKQKAAALAVAACADIVQVALLPLFAEGGLSPFDAVLDAFIAMILFAMLGFRWRTLLALGLELVPGVALFPTWSAMVATIPSEAAPRELPENSAVILKQP